MALDRFSPILPSRQKIGGDPASELDYIPGVGEETVRTLLKHFGSSELVRKASEDELSAQVGRAAARRVKLYYAAIPEGPVQLGK